MSEAPDALIAAARHDFSLSFAFSQGVPRTQTRLLRTLHKSYLERWERQALRKVAELHSDTTGLLPRIPHGHPRPVLVMQEATRHWKTFRETVLLGNDARNTSYAYERIMTLMIYRDIKLVSQGRDSLIPEINTDPHASFFRNFVWFEAPTTSPAFDATFRDIRELAPEIIERSQSIGGAVLELATAWETHHPGEQFLSQ